MSAAALRSLWSAAAGRKDREALTLPKELPAFVSPMLARASEPFDSEHYLFELKWDGIRALVFCDRGAYRIRNRHGADITCRYPEFDGFAGLERGAVLDGEIVVLRDGKPDFSLLQSRDKTASPLRQRTSASAYSATFIAFDQLYTRYHSLLGEALEERRRRLQETVEALSQARLVLSEGVVGCGVRLFDEVSRQELEGVMAKRLGSRYRPGKRHATWLKIKPKRRLVCSIMGFVPASDGGFKCLVLAAEEDGELHCVGQVTSGFTAPLRRRLSAMLCRRRRPKPLVSCRSRARWVEPGLYCTVSYLGRTRRGNLRSPVFERLIVDEGVG